MKRFSRFTAIEILEEKRLKAADLAACSIAHGPAFVEAAEATPACAPVNDQLRASNVEQLKMSSTNAVAEESDDESDSEEQENETEQETDGSDDNETDGSDDNETDGSDDSETDDTDDTDDGETDDTDDSETDDQEMNFSAELTGTGEGTASVETESDNGSTETDFDVKITGAPASQTFQVTVGSTVVGSITTDAQGAGKLKLASNPDDGEEALPTDFPTVDGTTTISVGIAGETPILTGTFATDTESADVKPLSAQNVSSSLHQLPTDLLAGGSGSTSISAPIQMSASSAPTARSESANSLDPNLVDIVYATAGNPHVSEEQSALLECNTNPTGDAAELAFESIVNNPLSWTV
jgi:hypothetical protein